jgi:LysM repeat protein
VRGIDWRAEARRYAVPVLVLLVVTLGALIVRGALDDSEPAARVKPAPREPAKVSVKRAAVRFHLVESGDTLGGIAERYGTTVARLHVLNPSIDAGALRVGQQIRLPAPDR